MKSTIALAAISVFAVLAPTLAVAGDKVDMAEITCQQFLADQDGILPTIIWIDGYLSHQSGDTVIDMDQLVANAKEIATSCAGEPDKTIMEMMPEDE